MVVSGTKIKRTIKLGPQETRDMETSTKYERRSSLVIGDVENIVDVVGTEVVLVTERNIGISNESGIKRRKKERRMENV